MDRTNKILIYGVGNEILTDDGIGPKIVKHLSSELDSNMFSFETSFLGGFELLEYIQSYKTVIFIDAIRTKDGIPGDVYYLQTDDFKETLHLSNIHDVSFLTALQFGEKVGLNIPNEIHIIAIEIVEDLVFSNEFSPKVKEKYPEIFTQIREFIFQLTSKNEINKII